LAVRPVRVQVPSSVQIRKAESKDSAFLMETFEKVRFQRKLTAKKEIRLKAD
jgi:hypothetical protein